MPRPRFLVRRIELRERDVTLRLPFRFGVVTLRAAPQAFVRAQIRLADGREGWGAAADILAPKWFDKTLELTNEQNFEQLRTSIRLAAERYVGDHARRTAFGHFAMHYAPHTVACAGRALNPLVASFGPAIIDRALLDALLRLEGRSFFSGMRRNIAGIEAGELTPELEGFDIDEYLESRPLPRSLAARHTVGLVDPLTAADVKERVGDGLPETLEEVIAAYGHRWFKLKVAGDVAADLARLEAIAAIIDRVPGYAVTIDGNEQYKDVDGMLELWARMSASPKLARLVAATRFFEQPIARSMALAQPVRPLARAKPVLLDESDATLDAFVQGRALGYTGVSSKACKGIYKSILNAARCVKWNGAAANAGVGDGAGAFFMSAEDLTCQAGLAVQQDLALVALLGIPHVERNGHHYVAGFAGAPAPEQQAFLAAHGDLYQPYGEGARLRITDGRLELASLDQPGFGAAAHPDWDATRLVAAIEI